MRTWKDFHWDTSLSASLLLVLKRLQFVSSWSPFVSNRIKMFIKIEFHLCRNDCIETSVHLKFVPDSIAHTMRCTVGSIQHGRRMTWKNVIASSTCTCIIVVNCSAIQEINLLLENENREKLLANQFWSARLRMSVVNDFSVPLFLNYSNETVPEINQSISQLYLNTVNGSASWFSDMPCDNYNL